MLMLPFEMAGKIKNASETRSRNASGDALKIGLAQEMSEEK